MGSIPTWPAKFIFIFNGAVVLYGYIYKVTNLITNKIYIGQKKSSVFLDTKYLGSGVLIRKAVAKYGKENTDKGT